MDFRVTTFSRSCVPIYPATCRKYSHNSSAMRYYVLRSMKGEVRFFELVLVQPLEIFLIESRSQWKGGLRFKIATFVILSSCVGISILTIQSCCKAVMKGELRFFGVSSLSHDFARAFSFSQFRKSVLFLAVSQEHYLTLHIYGKEELRFF